MNKAILKAGILVSLLNVLNGQLANNLSAYDANPEVVNILNKYSDMGILGQMKAEKDASLRFLLVLNEILSINIVINACDGSDSINVGFRGTNGKIYDSGISPESISDEGDRKEYKRLLSLNSENAKTKRKLYELRNELKNILKNTISDLPVHQKEASENLIKTLEKMTL